MVALLLATPIWAAGASDGQNAQSILQKLQQAATGEVFTSAGVEYKVVPNAVLMPSSNSAGQGVALGPYEVLLGSASAGRPRGTSSHDSERVAISQRTGSPVVVTNAVNVFCNKAGHQHVLAKQSGGRISYHSERLGLTTLEFLRPEAALTAAQALRGLPCVQSAEVEVIEQFDVAR